MTISVSDPVLHPEPVPGTIAAEVAIWEAKASLVYALADRKLRTHPAFWASIAAQELVLARLRRARTLPRLRKALALVPMVQRDSTWRRVAALVGAL